MPITYSRRRRSSGRKSRVPRAGFVDCLSAILSAGLKACTTSFARERVLTQLPAHVVEAVSDVAIRVRLDLGDLGLRKESSHFSRAADHERSRWNPLAFDQQRAGGDDRPGTDVCSVQQD